MLSAALKTRREEGVLVASIAGCGDSAGRDQLAASLEDLHRDLLLEPEVRVLVLEGTTPEAFCGQDPAAAPAEGDRVEATGRSLAGPVARLEVPVIAATLGDALGQGLELLLACDIRIAADTAVFGLPHIAQGQLPDDGGTQRLSRLVGKARALEMVLTGRPISAAEALRIGLVNRLCPPAEVAAEALTLARELAAKAPIALRYAKEAVLAGTELPLAEALRLEGDLYLLLETTRDRTEGISAFLRRQEPRFAGH